MARNSDLAPFPGYLPLPDRSVFHLEDVRDEMKRLAATLRTLCGEAEDVAHAVDSCVAIVQARIDKIAAEEEKYRQQLKAAKDESFRSAMILPDQREAGA
jgi:hypothetical protein